MKRFQFTTWRHLKVVRRQSTLYIYKKLYGPVLWMGFNCLKASATSKRQFTFHHKVLRNPWFSLYRSRKDEKLSRPWRHPAILNTSPVDWESSTLTTRPLLHKGGFYKVAFIIANITNFSALPPLFLQKGWDDTANQLFFYLWYCFPLQIQI